jgi:SAM-dependent methyltransferase
MVDNNNKQYLLEEQYKDASNLNARIQLHKRFSTHPVNLHRWIFDRLLALPADSRILELGCGPGMLWRENVDRIPAGWQVTLSDFSAGMIHEAQSHLEASQPAFAYQIVDAESIPFAADTFDAIIANHMLYHVPNRDRAFAEIHRVLKPNGILYAATNGAAHLRETSALLAKIGLDIDRIGGVDGFTLENGAQQMASWFDPIECVRTEDKALKVTEVEPLVAFMLSIVPKSRVNTYVKQSLYVRIEHEIAEHGFFHITKDTGLFIAHKSNTY